MIIANQKPIKVIGFPKGSMTFEFLSEINRTHAAELISVTDFFALDNKNQFQYIVAEHILSKRRPVVDYIDEHNLDLITYIHDSVVLANHAPPTIGAGTFIFPYTTLLSHTVIGKHCVIGSYCLVGHYSTVGNNCQLRPGVMITGKATIGNNCMLNVRATVVNQVSISDNIELMAFTNVAKSLTEPGIYIGSRAKKINGLVSPNEI